MNMRRVKAPLKKGGEWEEPFGKMGWRTVYSYEGRVLEYNVLMEIGATYKVYLQPMFSAFGH